MSSIRNKRLRFASWLSLFFVLIACGTATAGGGPKNVLLVENTASFVSTRIAGYYRAARRIPLENVCDIYCSTAEVVSLAEYNDNIATPIRNFLLNSPIADRIDYIVVTKEIPLAVDAGYSSGPVSLTSMLTCLSETGVKGYLVNPYGPNASPRLEQGFSHQLVIGGKRLYLVTRLDGYTIDDVYKMIDGSIAAGKNGSILLDRAALSASAPYIYTTANNRIQTANDLLVAKGIPTVYDNSAAFVGEQTGLMGYFSWGSNDASFNIASYHSNKFAPGSIADSLVSTSGRTFNSVADGGQSLIADLISSGACGVNGFVSEPQTQYATWPDILFDRYTKGYNMAESFYMACPMLYWKSVVVGDPLMAAYANPPTISIKSSSYTLTGNAVISATVTDPIGVAWVEFYFDGSLLGRLTQAPYSVSLDTTKYRVGPHVLEVIAAQNSAVASQSFVSATVTISNPLQMLGSISDGYYAVDGQGVKSIARAVVAGTLEMGGGEFYVADVSRASGIRVVSSTIVKEGDVVDISGVMGGQQAERYINATSPNSVSVMGRLSTPLLPLVITGPSHMGGSDYSSLTKGVVGGVGLRNIGLLVKTCGAVSYVGSSAEPFVYIDDGTELNDGSGHIGLKINCRTFAKPPLGSFITVTGLSCCEQSSAGLIPVVKPRWEADIKVVRQ